MAVVDMNDKKSSAPPAGGRSTTDLPPSMVERMTLILDAFDGRATHLSLEETARRARLPRSTVHRILEQLVKLDWVAHAPIGYRLGRRALGLDGGIGDHGQLRAAAAPLLHDLHLKTGMVVHLSVLDDCENVYLDKVGGRFATTLPSRVGGRALAHSTAGGKAMLACIAPEQVDTLFGVTLPRCTDSTIADIAVLHQELSRIRQRRGLAFECGESTPGVACVASAIRGHEGPIGSISLCSDTQTAQLERVAPLVLDAAREVSRSLYPELVAPRRGRKPPPVPTSTFSAATMDRLMASSEHWI
ncbi:IclR family transcriptional regulator [Rhodococcus sp. MS16]|jgi:DNA-binding IclR family transcriptional regulator|uniref:IclR family transcriptional regulator n=1 Tax=Rhodococcus TaxID=1827 RepID=UPI001210213A|nr:MULTISPECIES: IclR family transcriptional regulator [unclassified Rhodococcus (in: high G+C Gram-positive bacteria)]NRI68549.1 IclR family transcriptional regulator [Rhodococcus sp. MS16]RZL23083.1 MAG: IclR family transcriptional regulator [Rhodococcus sp. (in: high G+C Gram-positive bacteria)]